MSITTRIESISNHLENAYNSLENIGVDLIGINKNISNLSTQIESVYADLPKVTDTNAEITLNNTKKGKMELSLKGNTSQFTTTGKQLIPFAKGTSSRNNVTLTASNDNIFHLEYSGDNLNAAFGIDNSLRNANYGDYVSWGQMVLEAGTYSLSYIYISGNTNATTSAGNTISFTVYGRDVGSSDRVATNLASIKGLKTNTSTTFTLDSSKEVNIVFYPYVHIDNASGDFYFKVQLEKNGSATDWEPYTGGIASPNPNYPQDIKMVTGNNAIKIKGKNLLPFNVSSQIVNDVTFTVNTDNSITMNGTASQKTTLYIADTSPLNGINGTITISSGLNNASGVRFGIYINGEYYNTSSSRTQTFNPITSSGRPYVQIDNGVTVNNLTLKPMVEYGSSATEYEPYQLQTYPINLGNIKLCKTTDNNYQDYIYKNNNNWYKKEQIKWTDLTYVASNNFYTNTTKYENKPRWGSQYFTDISSDSTYILCNKLITNTNNDTWNCIEGVSKGTSSKTLYFYIDNCYSYSDLNTFLQNTILIYPLEVPNDIEITDSTLIEQLENLSQSMSYKNQTNISQTNNNLPFIITASALSQNNS